MRRRFCLLGMMTLLAACGRKGDLSLPPEEPAPPPPPLSEALEPEDAETGLGPNSEPNLEDEE